MQTICWRLLMVMSVLASNMGEKGCMSQISFRAFDAASSSSDWLARFCCSICVCVRVCMSDCQKRGVSMRLYLYARHATSFAATGFVNVCVCVGMWHVCVCVRGVCSRVYVCVNIECECDELAYGHCASLVQFCWRSGTRDGRTIRGLVVVLRCWVAYQEQYLSSLHTLVAQRCRYIMLTINTILCVMGDVITVK